MDTSLFMKTLRLDPDTWDIMLDTNGNLALLDGQASIIQDVASSARTWAGECWFDTERGVPYNTDIFGDNNSLVSLYATQLSEEAKHVPNVIDARCILTPPGTKERLLTGTILVTLENGNTVYASF